MRSWPRKRRRPRKRKRRRRKEKRDKSHLFQKKRGSGVSHVLSPFFSMRPAPLEPSDIPNLLFAFAAPRRPGPRLSVNDRVVLDGGGGGGMGNERSGRSCLSLHRIISASLRRLPENVKMKAPFGAPPDPGTGGDQLTVTRSFKAASVWDSALACEQKISRRSSLLISAASSPDPACP